MTPEQRERRNARQRERYATDPDYRATMLARGRRWARSEAGRAKTTERKREWVAANKEHLRQKRAEWYRREMEKPENRAAAIRRAKKHALAAQGTTPEEVADRFDRQLGVCFICRSDGGKRGLVVDHDHATGRFRALLCSTCNTGLGLFRDSPHLLMVAAVYIEYHSKPIGESVPRPAIDSPASVSAGGPEAATRSAAPAGQPEAA